MDRSKWDSLIGPENGSDYAIAHTKVEDDYWDRLLSANPQLEPKECHGSACTPPCSVIAYFA
jgi:hypothetical protein